MQASNVNRELSHTQISTWLRCRQQWFYQYGLRLRPVEIAAPLDIGRAVHKGLETFFRGQGYDSGLDLWFQDASSRSILPGTDPDTFHNALQEHRTRAESLIKRVLLDVERRGLLLPLDDQGQPYIERTVRIPLAGWDALIGIIDIILLDPQTKSHYIVDWKTRGKFANSSAVDYDLQAMIYQYGARQLGIPITGSITYQISSKAPVLPKLNKDGSMSRVRIASDWDTYRGALIAAGLDPADYQAEMMPKLDTEFVRPIYALRSDESLDYVWQHVIEPAAWQIAIARDEIIENEDASWPDRRIVRHMSGMTCGGCAYRLPCLNEVSGYGAETILQEYYQTHRHDKLNKYLRLLPA